MTLVPLKLLTDLRGKHMSCPDCSEMYRTSPTDVGEIGLTEVIAATRARFWLVIAASAVVLTIGVVFLDRYVYQYKTEAFLDLRRDLLVYNTQRYAFYDKKQLALYLESQPGPDSEKERLLNEISENLIRRNVKPLLNSSQKGGDGSVVVGLELHSQSRDSAESAVGRLRLLAGYIIDTQLMQSMRNTLRDGYLASMARSRQLDTQIIDKSTRLRDMELSLKEMSGIAARTPPSRELSEQRLISNVGEAGRYLPPRVQVIGIESSMSSLRGELRELTVERERNGIRLGFYRKLYEVLPEFRSGAQMFEFFSTFVHDYFAKSGESENVQAVRNELMAAVVDHLRAQRLDRLYFTAGPSVPISRSGPIPLFGAIVLLASLSVAFGIVLALLVNAVSVRWKGARAINSSTRPSMPDRLSVASGPVE